MKTANIGYKSAAESFGKKRETAAPTMQRINKVFGLNSCRGESTSISSVSRVLGEPSIKKKYGL